MVMRQGQAQVWKSVCGSGSRPGSGLAVAWLWQHRRQMLLYHSGGPELNWSSWTQEHGLCMGPGYFHQLH